MIRQFLYLILFTIASLLLLCGCNDGESTWNTPSYSNEVTLTLRLPGFTATTRTVNENDITSLRVLFFKTDGSYLSEKTIDPSKIVDNGNGYKVVLPIDEGTESLWLIANYNGNINITNNSSQLILTDNPNSNDNLVFFGSSTIAELSGSNSPSIALTRTCAKTTLTVEAANFTLQEVKFYGTPNQGSIVPSSAEGEPAIPTGTMYATEGRGFTSDTPYYHYEAATGKCYLIIQGTYQGVKGFYKVGYIPEKSENNPQPKEVAILRNHHYIFTIAKVTSYGWKTEEEAIASEPDNRMTVLLKDDDKTIYNMIACKDYELGVCKDVRVPYDVTKADIRIVTSYKNNPQYTYNVESTGWVSDNGEETSKNEVETGDTHSAHIQYTLRFTLQPNENSETERTAEIIVRSGDLSRTVRIIQEGNSLRYNKDRKVLIYNLEEHGNESDYYDFLNEELQGETEKEMGVARDNGLHFRITNNKYYYTIPYITGDKGTIIEGKGLFTVNLVDNYWKIECTPAGNENYKIWKGNFSITNTTPEGNPITITYEVFHLGLFHKLSGGYQIEGPNRAGNRTTGWFYYEQVNVTGTDGQMYHILDRNMGASSNRFYSPAYVISDGRENACGGYFKIANTKEDMTLINALPPEGYEVPKAYHLEKIGIKTKTGDSYGTVAVKTIQSELAVDEIYFPLTGYMEGDVHKDEVHACLWSRSLVAGNQGFSPNSKEYGYWFRYFDVYGSSAHLGNMRIMTRSAGEATGEHKGLPVRCLKGPEVNAMDELPAVMEGRRRIYCTNVKNWNPLYIYFWANPNPEGIKNQKYPGFIMNKVDYEDTTSNLYYADIDVRATHIIFNHGENGPQTRDIPLEAGKDTYTNEI